MDGRTNNKRVRGDDMIDVTKKIHVVLSDKSNISQNTRLSARIIDTKLRGGYFSIVIAATSRFNVNIEELIVCDYEGRIDRTQNDNYRNYKVENVPEDNTPEDKAGENQMVSLLKQILDAIMKIELPSTSS